MSNVTLHPVNGPWFFEDPAKVSILRSEAATWLGTPFRPFSRAKGKTGGVDCVGLGEALMSVTGVIGANEFMFPRKAADYQPHTAEMKILDYLRGQFKGPSGSDQQSKRLARIFAEIELPEKSEPAGHTNIDPEIFLPGDIGILKRGGLFHVPIFIGGPHFINALPHSGVTEGTIHDTSFSNYLEALFRARART